MNEQKKKLKIYHWLIIAFIGMVIVGLGIGYAIDRSKNKSVQGAETQITSPKVETPKTEVKKDANVDESANDATQNTPTTTGSAKKETITPTPTSTSTPTTSNNNPVNIPTPIIVPTPEHPPVKTCDTGGKENLLAWYDEKISSENDRYNQEVRDIKADFSRRGIWGDCSEGLCKAAVDQATTTHNHNINDIDYWLQSELSKINCSN